MTTKVVRNFKSFGLFALLVLTITSCEKEIESIGVNLVDNNVFSKDIYSSVVSTENINIDRVPTNGISQYLLGVYNDNEFGKLKASIITQLNIPTTGEAYANGYGTNTSIDYVLINIPYQTTKKENYSGSAYTSARLLTKDKFSFKYGKVEVRAKLPVGVGTWPAAWMLGANINTVNWPNCGEIDIMEHKGSDVNKIYGTLHYPGNFGGNAVGGTKVITGATTEFHVYTCEWTAVSIKFYIDDVLFYSFANNNTLPFNQNFFVLLNLAMGGTFGGTVDAAFTNATFEVDYVRVYQ